MNEPMQCHDPNHVDVGPLTADDFYASSGLTCRTCHKRRTAVVNKHIAARMREGQPVKESHSRRPEETPEQEAEKLRQLEEVYSASTIQHGVSPEQSSPVNERGLVLMPLPESSYPNTAGLFLRQPEKKRISVQ